MKTYTKQELIDILNKDYDLGIKHNTTFSIEELKEELELQLKGKTLRKYKFTRYINED